MIPHSDKVITQVVDGGYLSWKYGAVSRMGWLNERHRFIMKSGTLICMDSRVSYRKQFYPEYKSHRKEKRAKRQHIFERVKAFQAVLEEDPSIRKFSIAGLEADDLVTILGVDYDLPVIGRDKDLLQNPIYLIDASGEEVTLDTFKRTLPKTLRDDVTLANRDVLLVLTLLGDKSDDIPRLIPPRRLDILTSILKSESPWELAYELYRDRLLTNLYLAHLPGPWVYLDQPDPQQLYEDVKIYGRYQGVLRQDIQEQLDQLIASDVLVDPERIF